MTNGNLLVIACLAVGGFIVGLLVRSHVNRFTYRRGDETGLPSPGSRWWVPGATAMAAGFLGWRFGMDRWPLLLPTVPIAAFGPWLSTIDLDVRRLPNRVLLIHGVVVGMGVATAAAVTGTIDIALSAVVVSMITFAAFWILDRFQPGGIGWGDGKYATVLALASGSVSPHLTWWGFMIACVAAVLATPFRRAKRSFPLGPWLFLGVTVAIVVIH